MRVWCISCHHLQAWAGHIVAASRLQLVILRPHCTHIGGEINPKKLVSVGHTMWVYLEDGWPDICKLLKFAWNMWQTFSSETIPLCQSLCPTSEKKSQMGGEKIREHADRYPDIGWEKQWRQPLYGFIEDSLGDLVPETIKHLNQLSAVTFYGPKEALLKTSGARVYMPLSVYCRTLNFGYP